MSRFLFRLTAAASTVFVITILASVALLLSDPEAPVNAWFNRHGTTVLIVEVVLIVVLGLAAMTADRRETLRAKSAPPSPGEPPASTN
jgi:uncharacterized membrane protein YkgB